MLFRFSRLTPSGFKCLCRGDIFRKNKIFKANKRIFSAFFSSVQKKKTKETERCSSAGRSSFFCGCRELRGGAVVNNIYGICIFFYRNFDDVF
jgi:hypothetical protein